MSLEAMETLAAAEDLVQQLRYDAAAQAKQALAEAQTKGEQLISDAVRKAETELEELNRQTDEKAKAEAAALADSNENRKAVLFARAEARADKAAAFLVERIGGG